jgi:tetratricopeptide (TPR) repeat protein
MDLPWHYQGVVHEYPACEVNEPAERMPGDFHIVARVEGGARNRKGNKFARDVELLSGAVAADPKDSRSVFYLAQSYYDQGDAANAEKWYRRRAEMGGWQEEVFYSLMRVGLSMEAQGFEYSRVCSAMLSAWESRPQRAEPLCHLARISRLNKFWNQAYLYSKHASQLPFPQQDALFVDESVWRWRVQDELSIAAYWTGRFEESRTLCKELLRGEMLPDDQVSRVEENRRFAVERLAVAS